MAHKQSLVLDVMLPELRNVNSCSKGYFWRTNVDNSVKVREWTELVDTSCANLCKNCWGLTNFIFSHILHGYFRDIQNIEDTDKIQFPRDFFAFSCLLVFSILYCMLVLLDRLLFCFQAVWVSLLCVKSAIWLTLFAFSLYTYIFFCLFVFCILCFCIFVFLF